MAGMIKSIFGLTTEDVRQQQRQQQQKLATQLMQQGTSPFAAQFGTAFGGALGRGLMSRLGIQDPAMAKAQEVEARQLALNEQLASLSPDDPQRFYIIGQALVDAGDSAEASRYFALGRQAEALGRQTAMSEKEFEFRQQQQAALESSREQTAAQNMFNSLLSSNLTSVEEALKITKDTYPNFNISQSYIDAMGGDAVAAQPQAATTLPDVPASNQQITVEEVEKAPVGTVYTLPEEGRVIKTKEGFKLVADLTMEELEEIRQSSLGEGIAKVGREVGSKVGESVAQGARQTAERAANLAKAIREYNPQQPGIIPQGK